MILMAALIEGAAFFAMVIGLLVLFTVPNAVGAKIFNL